MLKYIISIFIVQSINILAQVSVSTDSVRFPQINTGASDSIFLFLKNEYSESSYIRINSIKKIYTFSDSALIVPANDSLIVWVKYTPNQNVIDNDLMIITSEDSTIGTIIQLSGSGKYGDIYDATTFNLYDTQLKNALTQLVNGHTSLGYNVARDNMYMVIDNQKVNGQGATQNTLECVYTGRLAVGYINRTDAQNNYNFNTEHTWPQSNFGEAEPMKSDLYHLYPTDNPANAIRSNYAFGNVVSNITWQIGGSKLGSNNIGQIVFEPRDVHKGDVSRSMFYFITRYPVNYGNFFTQTQENVFREWNKLDSVGTVESNRNNAIALLQGKRNPFIDHPEFADRIYSFTTNNVGPVIAELIVLPLKLNFDSTTINNTTSKQIYIANTGSAQLIVDSVTISDTRFTIDRNNISIEPYSSLEAMMQFNPDSIKKYDAILTVYSNGGNEQIVLTGIGNDNTVNIEDRSVTLQAFYLEQNYPNPFNPSTIISWSSSVSGWQTLKIYDILGNKVATLVNEFREAGNYEVTFSSLEAGQAISLPSGVYFYRLQAGDFIDTKKMLYLK